MADNIELASLSPFYTTESSTSKWKPFWDENYKRYYWSDGSESVWETPKDCVEPPPPPCTSESSSAIIEQQYKTNDYTLPMAYTTNQIDLHYQPYIAPPVIPSTINTGKRLVGQEARDRRQLYHYFDYNAWNEELNRNNDNQKKKVKLTKKELHAIKARRAEIKRKHRDKWLLED
ncbi:unnamed protein product [Rotaria magnacalcarata]|uniref:WW domain-containing protein n=2 Tax=Rotaria magnacalcarata TaxID=392030 RepID=A0A816LTT8_9BILA|nr:unnamed protein product [Rotaria magnacalcarata]CAF2043640.1 unnamed protein product [Rotaria magnacalcarata]CAF3789018.1 unnamed protein product [Rotaria magnacalcarata]CAF4253094.1 unnamed protein product [Rotaria magnacalcarata]